MGLFDDFGMLPTSTPGGFKPLEDIAPKAQQSKPGGQDGFTEPPAGAPASDTSNDTKFTEDQSGPRSPGQPAPIDNPELEKMFTDPGIMNALQRGIDEGKPGFDNLMNMMVAAKDNDTEAFEKGFTGLTESLGLEKSTQALDPLRQWPEWEKVSNRTMAAFDTWEAKYKKRWWEDNWENLLLKGLGAVVFAVGAHNGNAAMGALGGLAGSTANRAMKQYDMRHQQGLREYMSAMASPTFLGQEQKRKDIQAIATSIYTSDLNDPTRTTPRTEAEYRVEIKRRLQKANMPAEESDVDEVLARMPTGGVYEGATDERKELRERTEELWEKGTKGRARTEQEYSDFLEGQEGLKRFPGMRDRMMQDFATVKGLRGEDQAPREPMKGGVPTPSLSGEAVTGAEVRAGAVAKPEPKFDDAQTEAEYMEGKSKVVRDVVNKMQESKFLAEEEMTEKDVQEMLESEAPEYNTAETISAIMQHPDLDRPPGQLMEKKRYDMVGQMQNQIVGSAQAAAAAHYSNTEGTIAGKTLGDVPDAMKIVDAYLGTQPDFLDRDKKQLREVAAKMPVDESQVYAMRERKSRERDAGIMKDLARKKVDKVLRDPLIRSELYSRFVNKLGRGEPTDALDALSTDISKHLDEKETGLNDEELSEAIVGILKDGLTTDTLTALRINDKNDSTVGAMLPDRLVVSLLDELYSTEAFSEKAWTMSHITDNEADVFPPLEGLASASPKPLARNLREISENLKRVGEARPVGGKEGKGWNVYIPAGDSSMWEETFGVSEGSIPDGAFVSKESYRGGAMFDAGPPGSKLEGGGRLYEQKDYWKGSVPRSVAGDTTMLWVPLFTENRPGSVPNDVDVEKAIDNMRDHPEKMSYQMKLVLNFMKGALSEEDVLEPQED